MRLELELELTQLPEIRLELKLAEFRKTEIELKLELQYVDTNQSNFKPGSIHAQM